MLDIVSASVKTFKVDYYFFTLVNIWTRDSILLYLLETIYWTKWKIHMSNLRIHDAICQQCLLYIYLWLFDSILNCYISIKSTVLFVYEKTSEYVQLLFICIYQGHETSIQSILSFLLDKNLFECIFIETDKNTG